MSHYTDHESLLQASISTSTISSQILQMQQTQQQMIMDIRDALNNLTQTVETIAQKQSRIEEHIASVSSRDISCVLKQQPGCIRFVQLLNYDHK